MVERTNETGYSAARANERKVIMNSNGHYLPTCERELILYTARGTNTALRYSLPLN
jgi:hypothetical protein